MRRFVSRLLRATRIVVHDGRIPRPLRWGGAFAVLPIPGPLDELVLLTVGAVLWLFYRDQLREAWRSSLSKVQPGRDYVLIVRPGLAEASEQRGFEWLTEQIGEVLQKVAA